MVYVEVQPDSDYWNPQHEGEVLEGVYVESHADNYGDCYIIETSPGVRKQTRAHTSLQARMANVNIGSRVLIEYRGEVMTKRGAMKKYKVSVWA